ncbi:H(+)/Cl(-) exchange transporter 5 [Thelohanellus kitauei]|uniref:H(+)/Cl(-) exchange transporter 5 n=1 Tax=Thelohanellus kitauei TaxID=669202 RepID=A0A0C2N788_THEKT|nr:H(+)/Cl(-) exchange transporter 5 [Thelohanellus kitauei]
MLEQLEMELFEDENFEFYPEIEYSAGHNSEHGALGPYMPLFRRKLAPHKHYDDFQTIDWLKERYHGRNRKIFFDNLIRNGSFMDKASFVYEKCSTVLVLALVGIVCSFTSFVVSMGVHFFSDLREGVCTTKFLFNKHECCWKSTYDSETCSSWVTWSHLLSKNPSNGFINFLFYTSISLLLSYTSGVIVYYLAPYASGGGISEVIIF